MIEGRGASRDTLRTERSYFGNQCMDLYRQYVQDEVTTALDDPSQFQRGPRTTTRGTMTDDRAAFVVEDANYLSARWPGDAYLFAKRFIALLNRG